MNEHSEPEVKWDTLVVLDLDEFSVVVGDVDEVEVERDGLSGELELHWLSLLLRLIELDFIVIRVL